MEKVTYVSLLQMTDHKGDYLRGLCVPAGASSFMSEQISEDFDYEWVGCHDEGSVILEIPVAVQVTDPETLRRVATWLFSAAAWLDDQIDMGLIDE